MKQPLENLMILDLSRVYAAPAGTMILGDLGADVIRIEHPKNSDSMREWGPMINDVSSYYISANRNKRSITLNLKKPQGKEIFRKLVKKADVVVENFKTGTMERLGLGYEELKKINNKIIMCSVTGYGHTGPAKNEPGFDPVIQAMSGVMDVTGQSDGEATKVGIPIADIVTSHFVAISILSALRMLDQTNEGQQIDLSLLDAQLSSMANVSSSYLNAGIISKRVGNRHNNVSPYQIFQCSDGPIMLAIGNDRLFISFCKLINRRQWIDDEKYQTSTNRKANENELVVEVQKILWKKTVDEWLTLFIEYDLPASKVNTIEEVFNHPQTIARNTVETMEHPIVGPMKMTRNPMRFSSLCLESRYAPPLLGEHTFSFLKETLKFTELELEKLKAYDII